MVASGNDCSSAIAAVGTSSYQCPQSYRDLTLIRIAKPSGCFIEFVSAGLDPKPVGQSLGQADIQRRGGRCADAAFGASGTTSG
jgi:hypothetical protein